MAIKVGINGFGRIGRLAFRAAMSRNTSKLLELTTLSMLIICLTCFAMTPFMVNLMAQLK